MINHHIAAALASERHNTLLREAQADREAKQARSQRRPTRGPVATRSPRRWIPRWLAPDRIRRQFTSFSQPACPERRP